MYLFYTRKIVMIWHFYLTSKDGKCVQCKMCKSVLKTLGGSTKGLHTQLSSNHGTKTLPSTSTSLADPTASHNVAVPSTSTKVK